MTETERKALELVNDVCRERSRPKWICIERATHSASEALCRAIEQHEAFKQEVSDAAEQAVAFLGTQSEKTHRGRLAIAVARFIITKPDPLVAALKDMDFSTDWDAEDAKILRAALTKRGLEIREKK